MAKQKVEKEGMEAIFDKLEKKYGVGVEINMNPTIISTGSIQLNQAMKVGGTPLGKMIEVIGNESSGKAQPLSSLILTPSGWVEMRDIEVGSIICTPDGENSTVINTFPQGEKDVYKITLDDKSYTKCTTDHLWYVNRRVNDLGEVKTLQEIINEGIVSKNGCRKFRVPTVEPITFEQYGKITIDPYLLGILIGDGGFTNGNLRVTICDPYILEEVNRILLKDYDDVILSSVRGSCDYSFKKKKFGRSKTEILKQIIELGLHKKYSYEKHIPKEYLYTTIENRLSLLQGLMDSDGTVSTNALSYSSSSPQLSRDFEELTRSLGFRCVTSTKKTSYTSPTGNKVDGRISYRSSLQINSLNINPFRCLTKKSKFIPMKGRYCERYIEKIEFIGREECKCIAIGHPDQLYITDNFIVTHNTTTVLHQMAEYQKAFPERRVVYLDYEHSFDPVYASAIGVDVDTLKIYQPYSMESGYDLAVDLIKSDLVSCIVIDSQTAAEPKAAVDGQIGDSTIALQARINSKFCLKVKGLLDLHKTTLFFVSQIRANVGAMMGDGLVSTGGYAIKFYSDVRWKIWKTAKKDDELNITTIDVIKSKVGKPYGQAKVNILWGYGFDKVGEVVEYAIEFGFMGKAGAGWYTIGENKIQGMDKLREIFENDPETYKDLHQKVIDKLNE